MPERGRRALIPPDPSDDAVAGVPALVGRTLDRTWAWVARLSGPAFTGLLLAFVVVRTGITAGASEATLLTVRQFPEPIADYRANSVIGPAVGHLLGVEGEQGWVLLHLAVIVVGVAVVAWCLASALPSPGGARMAAIWLGLSAVAPSILKKVGSYDPWTVVGFALMVLPRRHRLPSAVVGGAVVGLANAEQGLVGLAGATAVLVSLPVAAGAVEARRERLMAFAWGAGAVVVSRAAVLGWWAHLGAEVPSRLEVFDEYLAGGLERAIGAGLAGAYTWFGVAWAAVALVVLVAARSGGLDRRCWIGLGSGLVGVPALVTATTLDGTRVFAMVSLPALLVALCWLDAMATSAGARRLLQRCAAGGLLAGVVLPALTTDTGGGLWFMLPWAAG